MSEDQDWRLRVDLPDAAGLHARLRGAHHFERELQPLIGDDVVLSHDEETLFAYANSEAGINEARRAIEHQLAADGLTATVAVSHWDDDLGDWHQVEPPEGAAQREHEQEERAEHEEVEARDERIVTRTVAITSGRMVRKWFETTVANEAREVGVELEIVEHPHLLTTQLAFTLTGPAAAVEQVIADLKARAMQVTRLETNFGIIT
jgi:hypothetical protein